MRALSFDDRWHFVALMAMTNDGTLEEQKEVREALVEVNLGLHGVDLANTKKRLMALRLIGDDWKPLQWEWRQAGSDPAHVLRQRKYRESLKKRKRDVTGDARVTQKVTVEEEVEVEVEEEKHKARPARNQIPPTFAMVQAYCKERCNGIDPYQFISHYEANGWMRGKTKLKDWQAAVRTWECSRKEAPKSGGVGF
jgi:hypothetical protein